MTAELSELRDSSQELCGIAKKRVAHGGRMRCLWPCAIVVAGCGSSTAYHGGSSWSVSLPSGWHRVNFSDSVGQVVSAGLQISNVPLKRPTLMPGYPIQANGNTLLAGGLALIVATDRDRQVPYGHAATLPPPSPNASGASGWTFGSALAGQPYLETLTFRAAGRTFVADLKVGPSASGSDLKALAGIVRSLHILS
jgi:hypothetical protein